MLDRIEFLFSEAFTALRRNTWMTFAAITTSCMALFLTGGVAFAYKGVDEYANSLPSRFEIRVFLKDKATDAEVTEMNDRLKRTKGIKSVEWIPKAKAWEAFKKQNPDFPTDGIINPLPDAFTLTLTNVDDAEYIASRIQSMPSVAKDGVLYLKREREMLSQALKFLQWIGFGLGGMMVLTSGVLIYNAIRMTIVARRREFRIMQLVGASPLMVTVPLMIEGVVQGICGGILASFLVLGAHRAMQTQLQGFSGIIKIGALAPNGVFITMMLLGAAYGLICSIIAVRDPRRFE
ncbi:MAG: ABC transporter permease [Armatimonadetes bacterium]|nr:ABC transporter permease [Armatimonadota bacterium]